MAPFTSWLPARSSQDFDLVVKIVGPGVLVILKEWPPVAQFLVDHGFSVIAQGERPSGGFGDSVLTLRIASQTAYSVGHGCDILVHVGNDVPDLRRFSLQPGSVLLWQPPGESWSSPILPEGIIAYPLPLSQLCAPYPEGPLGKGFCALGALLHLLGSSEEVLRQISSLVKAPQSFDAGSDFARRSIEKRDAYSLPLLSTQDTLRRIILTPDQAILLGFAEGTCECRAACEKELISSPSQWTARQLGVARTLVSVLESDGQPGVQAYRGAHGQVMALLRGNDSAIVSCLNGFKAPRVFVAADIPDTFNLIMVGHDLVRNGLCDGVGVLIDETIAQRQQSADVHSLVDMIRRRTTVVSDTNVPDPSDSVATMAEWDGDDEADVGFVAWGAAQGVVRDAVALCRSFGLRVAGLYPRQIVPFHHDDIESFAKTVGRVVIVESGQTQDYWDRLRASFSFDYATLSPQQGQLLTPMDIFLREGLGAV